MILPTKLRSLFRRVEYHGGVLTGRQDPLVPPDWLRGVGGGFEKMGEKFFRFFVDYGGLAPDERVLDVGCGTGRMARPLTKYLTSGTYDGIDIVEPSIKWCQRAYRKHPNFQFHFTDIYNKMYNPAGKHLAAQYRFPFGDGSFDFVFLTSVFTHMLPADVENYLAEVARCLSPGGRRFATFYLHSPAALGHAQQSGQRLTFAHELDGCRVQNPAVPEEAVAYPEPWVRALFRRHGLTIPGPVRHGLWGGNPEAVTDQDIIIAGKPAPSA